MKISVRDVALGAATMALLLYAAITAARSMAGTLPGEARLACGVADCSTTLQVARNRD